MILDHHQREAVELGLRRYRHRSYILHKLDRRHFDALNRTPVYRDARGELHEAARAPVLALNGYCLDAPDSMPAGAQVHGDPLPAQAETFRGLTLRDLEERDALAARLIAEILAGR